MRLQAMDEGHVPDGASEQEDPTAHFLDTKRAGIVGERRLVLGLMRQDFSRLPAPPRPGMRDMKAARRIGIKAHELKGNTSDPAHRLARTVQEVARTMVPALVDAVQVALRPLKRRHEEVTLRPHGLDDRLDDRLRPADDMTARGKRRMDEQRITRRHPDFAKRGENRLLADLRIGRPVPLRRTGRHHRLDNRGFVRNDDLQQTRRGKRSQMHALARRYGEGKKRRVPLAVKLQHRLLVRLLKALRGKIADETRGIPCKQCVKMLVRKLRLRLQHDEHASRILTRKELCFAHDPIGCHSAFFFRQNPICRHGADYTLIPVRTASELPILSNKNISHIKQFPHLDRLSEPHSREYFV